MPAYRRWRGEAVFLTIVTAGRRPLFLSALARQLLHDAIARTAAERPVKTAAAVLLPDHLHLLWQLPPDDLDYSARVALIKKRFTRRFLAAGGDEAAVPAGQQRHRLRGVWQRRFWEHVVRRPRDFRMHVDYIHANPVKHQLARRPIDWPWSTFRNYVRRGWYEREWCGRVDLAGQVRYFFPE